MSFLGNLYASIGLDTTKLRKGATEAKQTVTGLDSSFKNLSGTVLNLKTLMVSTGAVFAAFAAKDLWDTVVMIDQMNRAFKAITGNASAASRELNFIRESAASLGQEFYSVTDSFKFIAAAAKDTALEGEGVRDIFMAVSEAGTALGLTNVQVKMSLYAISQMISKGTVNAEELRQQLGERLPGAYQAMARALGVTTAELNKMLEQGEVIATDALPKLADELHRMFRTDAFEAADKPIGILNRFKTAWIDLKAEISSGNFLIAASDALTKFTAILQDKDFQNSVKVIIDDMAALARAIVWLTKKAAWAVETLGYFLDILENLRVKVEEVSKESGSTGIMAVYDQAAKNASIRFLSKEQRRRKELADAINNIPVNIEPLSYNLTTDPERKNILGTYDLSFMWEMSDKEAKKLEKQWSYTAEKLAKLASEASEPFEEDWGELTAEQKAYNDYWTEVTKKVWDYQEAIKAAKIAAAKIELDAADLYTEGDYQEGSKGFQESMLRMEMDWANTLEDMKKTLGETLFEEWKKAPWNEKSILAERNLELSRRNSLKDHKDFWQIQAEDRIDVHSRSLDVMYESEIDFHEQMSQLTERTAEKMQDNFSDLFFDVLKGEFVSFRDFAESLFDSILRAYSDMMGQMVVKGLFGKEFKGGGLLDGLMNWISGSWTPSYYSGASGAVNYTTSRIGSEGFSYDLSFAGGGYLGERVIGKGASSGRSYEFHPNEYILPQDLMGEGSSPSGNLGVETSGNGGSTYNINIYAIDSESMYEALKRNPEGVIEIVVEDLKDNGILNNTIRRTT